MTLSKLKFQYALGSRGTEGSNESADAPYRPGTASRFAAWNQRCVSPCFRKFRIIPKGSGTGERRNPLGNAVTRPEAKGQPRAREIDDADPPEGEPEM
jgi:hypothetical protein